MVGKWFGPFRLRDLSIPLSQKKLRSIVRQYKNLYAVSVVTEKPSKDRSEFAKPITYAAGQ